MEKYDRPNFRGACLQYIFRALNDCLLRRGGGGERGRVLTSSIKGGEIENRKETGTPKLGDGDDVKEAEKNSKWRPRDDLEKEVRRLLQDKVR